MSLRRRKIAVAAAVFGTLVASVAHPYAVLLAGWAILLILYRWWARAVVRECEEITRAKGLGARFFEYGALPRYIGWAVFSGMFCFLLPVTAAEDYSWPHLLLRRVEHWYEIPVFALSVLMFFGAFMGLPMQAIVNMLTAPVLAVLDNGIRAVPLPFWSPRNIAWSEIDRLVIREPRRGTRRDPIVHYLYLRDGSFVPIYNRAMDDSEALIGAIARHVRVERTAAGVRTGKV